jgi:hypothetical protein
MTAVEETRMRRPVWQIIVLFIATFGLYSLYWWPKNWKFVTPPRIAKLIAFIACYALAWVPALRWGGWVAMVAALAVLLHAQRAVNRDSDVTLASFSLVEKVALGLAGVVILLAILYNVAGPAAN